MSVSVRDAPRKLLRTPAIKILSLNNAVIARQWESVARERDKLMLPREPEPGLI
jgi:hypothetical protein